MFDTFFNPRLHKQSGCRELKPETISSLKKTQKISLNHVNKSRKTAFRVEKSTWNMRFAQTQSLSDY